MRCRPCPAAAASPSALRRWPRENLTKIFDFYFSTKEKGSGIGLALALQIVEEHGGVIKVESELGRGSTFFVFLPV
ncbi:hypothetical protein FBQ85_18490 [Cytophagia bacterium CHB2]|nr:hypothetical protein [Cytophagia bacterium CHB2]